MAAFDNSKILWDFIKNGMNNQNNLDRIYSSDVFFKDLKRSSQELYINGVLIDPVLDQTRKLIDFFKFLLEKLLEAIKSLNQHPDNIKQASEIIASIKELGTDSFETELLNVAELIHSLPDSLAKAFQSFCAIRRFVLSLQNRGYAKEQIEENYNQIKKELITAPEVKVDTSQIETIFFDKAANKIFNRFFENNKKIELKDYFEQKFSKTREEYFKKFLKLFLHQNFIFPNINLLNELGKGVYLFSSPSKRKIELSHNDDGLFIQVSFFTQKIFDSNAEKALEAQDEDFFVKGVAKYKINIISFNETSWMAKYDLVDSSLECKEKFKEILDTRTILEKFQEILVKFFDEIQEILAKYFDKIKPNTTLNQSVNTHKTKFKPLFFVSNSGESVSEIILDDAKPRGNILDLTIDNMRLNS